MFTAFLSQLVGGFRRAVFLFAKFYTNLSYPTGHIMLVKKKITVCIRRFTGVYYRCGLVDVGR